MNNEELHHKQLLLHWWPQYLVGVPEGGMFAESLEQALWACENFSDAQDFFRQMAHIWGERPEDAMAREIYQPLFSGQVTGAKEYSLTVETPYLKNHLRDHFGVQASQVLHHLFCGVVVERANWTHDQPPRHALGDDVKMLARDVANQFGLSAIHTDQSSDQPWVMRQLLDMRMGFANLSTILKLPHPLIGRNNLHFWLHQWSSHRHTVIAGSHCDIHMGGGDVARTWMQWALGQCNTEALHNLHRDWKQSWDKSPRHTLQRQQHFLHMQKRKFRNLLNQTEITSDFGARATRRYKAFCKWVDDIERGLAFDQTIQAWHKVKTGNRIAWAGDGIDRPLIQAWQAVEKQVEEHFFAQPDWSKPSWIRHRDLSIEQAKAYWGLMFEAYVRHQMGYDSWLAMERSNHPIEEEMKKSQEFIDEHLLPLLQ